MKQTILIAFMLMAVLGLIGCGRQDIRTTETSGRKYDMEGLRVSGTAVVRAKPELATIRLGHTTKRVKAKNAKKTNDEIMTKVIKSIRALGVAEEDIQTASYNMNPVMIKIAENKYQRQWSITNILSVRVKDVEKMPDVIDSAANAGADIFNEINYSLENMVDLKSKAREQALEIAQNKAKQTASKLGCKLRIVAVNETSSEGNMPWNYSRNATMKAQYNFSVSEPAVNNNADKQLSEGQMEVTVRMDLIYAIE